MEKLFSCHGLSSRIARRVATTSSIAVCCGTPGAGPTANRIHPLKKGTYFTKAPCGTPADGGVTPLNRLGGGVYTAMTWNGRPAILIVRPIGSTPSNSCAPILWLIYLNWL